MMAVLLVLQGVALVGSVVGGFLARRRRKELEDLNVKLREVLIELQKSRQAESALLCEARPEEALVSYRNALENSLKTPAAAHPIESYGAEQLSLASARRRVSKLLHDARGFMAQDRYDAALCACDDAIRLANQIADKRAVRAVYRVKAKTQKRVRDHWGAVASLERALELSRELQETVGDADTLGTLADVYVEIGDFEKASRYYDELLAAIQSEDSAVDPASGSWDC